MPELALEQLRRWPDVEAPELQAHDATDAYLLDETGLDGYGPDEIVVIGDRYGALTLGLLAAGATGVRTHQDGASGELALAANAERAGLEGYASLPLDESLLQGARLVLLQLPRGLDALDEVAGAVARWAHPSVRLVAGGRVKHMSLAQNEVLARHFDSVEAGLARQKSRLLRASGPRPTASAWPRRARIAELDLDVLAHGAAFGGTALDPGSRLLLQHLDRLPAAGTAVDLGCGTGLLAATLARRAPGLRVVATDQSAAAVASARATAAANGLDIEVVRADAMSAFDDGAVDLVLLNPPFHIGATVHAGIARKLMADAARALRPGGVLWTVWNSHLQYAPDLRRLVGSTEQVARDRRFTVTRSVRTLPASGSAR
ncbi:class I SAM-dependent methyltransferase [Arenivirga flava]|uniref:16S RNA G1207 methylase RsmC n=1 Tax=Arenivirga flava TaxID=1930060 RepID=A0AA37UKG6_9MICO|nr:methyltransferase [Arenivirga flava]GMA28931.1 16S RNA G1207 methylase RsmC [Arenivirga flava]